MNWLKKILKRKSKKTANTLSEWEDNANQATEKREKHIADSPASKMKLEDIEWMRAERRRRCNGGID